MLASVEMVGLDKLQARFREVAAGLSREPTTIVIRSEGTDPAFLAAIHARPIQRPELRRDPFFMAPGDFVREVARPVGLVLTRVMETGLWGRWRPTLQEIARRWIILMQRNINLGQSIDEGGRVGRMRPLTAKYAARKLARYGRKPILRATDALYHSLRGELVRE